MWYLDLGPLSKTILVPKCELSTKISVMPECRAPGPTRFWLESAHSGSAGKSSRQQAVKPAFDERSHSLQAALELSGSGSPSPTSSRLKAVVLLTAPRFSLLLWVAGVRCVTHFSSPVCLGIHTVGCGLGPAWSIIAQQPHRHLPSAQLEAGRLCY